MKLKKKAKLLLSILIISIICGGLYFYPFNKNDNEKENKTVLKEHNIDEKYYSKALEYALKNNIYDETYLEEYASINYNNEENFSEVLTTFLPKNYKGKEINYILKLSQKNIDILKTLDYTDISKYYQYKNFDVSKINRYNEYAKNNNYSSDLVITYVNINLDLPVYTNTLEVKDPDDLLVLVNKYNCLPNNYKPSDLAYEPGAYGDNVPMRKIIQEPFQKLKEVAKNEAKMNLMPSTAFRTQSLQSTLYNNYVKKDGKEAADTYSARPGCSEHQTGLAIDLRNVNLGTTGTRLTDENYQWLEENAYKYGFIIRFPKEKEFVTGYQFENWHIRYVGLDIAKIIYENNLTLEEYIDLYETTY